MNDNTPNEILTPLRTDISFILCLAFYTPKNPLISKHVCTYEKAPYNRKLHKLQIFSHVTEIFSEPVYSREKKDNSDTHVFLTYFTKCQVVSKILLLYFV